MRFFLFLFLFVDTLLKAEAQQAQRREATLTDTLNDSKTALAVAEKERSTLKASNDTLLTQLTALREAQERASAEGAQSTTTLQQRCNELSRDLELLRKDATHWETEAKTRQQELQQEREARERQAGEKEGALAKELEALRAR